MSSFDLMNQLGWFALSRKQVVPPARYKERVRKTEHPIRDGIAPVMIVEEPCVNVLFAKSSLDRLEIHSCPRTTNYSSSHTAAIQQSAVRREPLAHSLYPESERAQP